jgi:hypothetical protein
MTKLTENFRLDEFFEGEANYWIEHIRIFDFQRVFVNVVGKQQNNYRDPNLEIGMEKLIKMPAYLLQPLMHFFRYRYQEMCDLILQPMRDYIGKPITITSGFRSVAHNDSLEGSAPNSHHLCFDEHCAVDITCDDLTGCWGWLADNPTTYRDTYIHRVKNFIHISRKVDDVSGLMREVE